MFSFFSFVLYIFLPNLKIKPFFYRDATSNHTFKILKGDQSEKFRISSSGWLECVDLTGLTDGCHVINYQVTDVGYPDDTEIESFVSLFLVSILTFSDYSPK